VLIGLNLRPGTPNFYKDIVTFVSGSFVFAFAIKSTLLRVQRFFGKKDALPEDQLALKSVVVDDMHSKLQTDFEALVKNISEKIEDTSQRNKAAVSAVVRRKFSELQALSEARDDEVEQSQEDASGSSKRLPKQQLLALVKDTVVFNFWSGNYFEESDERHVFQTNFKDVAGVDVRVTVRSPYRALHDDGGELPYVVQIHYQNRKMLDLQWDPADSDQRAKYLKRGDWEQAILAWNVAGGLKPIVVPEAARETWAPPQLVEKAS
jgi:hypothetical protein